MAKVGVFKRSSDSSRTLLLCYDSEVVVDAHGGSAKAFSSEGASLSRDLEDLSLSRCLERTRICKKKKKRKNMYQRPDSNVDHLVEDGGNESRHSLPGCLGLYLSGGGCRIDAGDDLDSSIRRRSNASEECLLRRLFPGVETVELECFSYNLPEKFRKKSLIRLKVVDESPPRSSVVTTAGFFLPDDLLVMILARLPFASLLAARCVCRTWSHLTTTSQFMQMRMEAPYKNPWLFLFGVVKNGCSYGEIHALDMSLDRWHRIDAGILKNRKLFSVVGVGSDIYIVGGCSSSVDHCEPLENSSLMVEKGVFVFSPLSGSWGAVSQMNVARSGPVIGAFTVSANCCILQRRHDKQDDQDRVLSRSRAGRALDVFEDPHRFSLRLQQSDVCREEVSGSSGIVSKIPTLVKQGKDSSVRFALISVGGCGSCNEPLETAEVYDLAADRWADIARLPREFGPACSGAVCGGKFYVYSLSDNLASFDLDRGFWMAIQTVQIPLHLHEYYPKFASCQNRLFMSSVFWGDEYAVPDARGMAVRKLWELDLGSHVWTEVSLHPDAPMDRNAIFVADENCIYGVEMFKVFGQMLDFLTVCKVSDSELQWHRVSRKKVIQDVDISSCTRKTLAVLHL